MKTTMNMMKKVAITVIALHALVACSSAPQLSGNSFKDGGIYYDSGVTGSASSYLPLDD